MKVSEETKQNKVAGHYEDIKMIRSHVRCKTAGCHAKPRKHVEVQQRLEIKDTVTVALAHVKKFCCCCKKTVMTDKSTIISLQMICTDKRVRKNLPVMQNEKLCTKSSWHNDKNGHNSSLPKLILNTQLVHIFGMSYFSYKTFT